MNFKYKEGDTGYVMSRKDGYIPVTIVSQVEYEGEPCYELDKLITVNKDETLKYGGDEEYQVEGTDYGMWYEEDYTVLPCPETEIFQLGEPCHQGYLSRLLGCDLSVILTEDMINRTKKF